MVKKYENLYINGQWVKSGSGDIHDIINPATGDVAVQIPMSGEDDVIRAISAARAAFTAWSQTTAQERSDYLNAIADEMDKRADDFSRALTLTLGCPKSVAPWLQVAGNSNGFRNYAKRAFHMERVDKRDGFKVVKEPIGVCTLINPWNYPLGQLTGKLAPALAAGCTVVCKPAEQTPLQDIIMAEIVDKIGLPAGVFNLILGEGAVLGPTLCGHEYVDMVSFTGSTRAGVYISQYAAPTIKRVTLELGGKSPYIITEDADLESAVRDCVAKVMMNTGQSCNAPTRLLIARSRYEEAVAIAKEAAEKASAADPNKDCTHVGPMSTERQRQTVLGYIETGIGEGARLVTGGAEMPEGLERGAYVRPTIFADVSNDMTIAQEEIFGPVLCMIAYDGIDQAVAMANDSQYGLSSHVFAKDEEAALAIATRIRAGQCFIQGGSFNGEAPFGGYKQSGNGREWGEEGLHEYCEIKAIIS
ncbi:aldehyde dehydrogenase family protein [Dasania marina]|uniref:aldehyde dehydrogenase family protein n=1 Tax=Dasania marina TaxID=471499 RepID=UPI0030D9C8F0|tara:strand:- start:17449 stop:18870 length:1422 start_codon:yes stop_codon:yes gene_type:complete